MRGGRREHVAEMLLDILVASLNAHKIPHRMGWMILESYQWGELTGPKGLRLLKRACMLSEPEKTRKVLEGVG